MSNVIKKLKLDKSAEYESIEGSIMTSISGSYNDYDFCGNMFNCGDNGFGSSNSKL